MANELLSPNRQQATGRGDRDERGVALVMAVLFGIVVSGLVMSGTMLLRAHRIKTETSFRLHGQATQFARAGLTESLGWFRRQAAQPVLDFEPILDTVAAPPVFDTVEPDVGIVREFEISGATWGRYEVWKEWEGDPDPVRLAWRRQVQVTDISTQRGAAGAGTVWRIRAVGYVFRRADPGVRFDVPPNRVLGTDILETELRRMTLAPPGEAAICTETPTGTTVNNRARVLGITGAGIFFPNTGTPTVAAGAVIGLPALASTSDYQGSVDEVFGVSAEDLRSLADDTITSDPAFPSPVPRNSLLVADTSLTFTAARPLRGNGIVYVNGDVTLTSGSNSFFTGFMYVDGNVTFNAPSEFNGSLVATGVVRVLGVSDFSNVTYDDGALNALRTEVGQYRLSGAIRSVVSAE
jgi:hypothetical protein